MNLIFIHHMVAFFVVGLFAYPCLPEENRVDEATWHAQRFAPVITDRNPASIAPNISPTVPRLVATRMPKLAASTVPAVDGVTNLLRANCCMIRPTTLMPMPAVMIAIKRGTRLTRKI